MSIRILRTLHTKGEVRYTLIFDGLAKSASVCRGDNYQTPPVRIRSPPTKKPAVSGRFFAKNSKLYQSALIFAAFNLIPGPIDEAMVALLIYCPFAAAGFALISAPMRVLRLSESCSSVKLFFPIGQ